MAGPLTWRELPEDAPEPEALSLVVDSGATLWVRPKLPGRADCWYRVGGGRGDSDRNWEAMLYFGPLFLAERTPAQSGGS